MTPRTPPRDARWKPGRWSLAALLVLAAGACAGPRSAPDPAGTGVVSRHTVEDVFLLTGELQAVRSVELAVPRVETFQVKVKWLAEDGSETEAGQTVAELDNTQVAQSLEEKRLRATQAQIALEEREASLEAEAAEKRFLLEKAAVEADKARLEADVPVELRSRKEWHEKQQALRRAESELEKARLAQGASARSSKAEVDGLRIAHDKARRDVDAAQDSLQHLKLVAPKAGVVILGRATNEDRPVQPGDNLFPGWRVASIPDLSAMEVIAYLPDVDDGRVKPGQAARVVLESDPSHALPGRVEAVAAVTEEVRFAGGFRVRVSLAETLPAMRPGLSARVEVVRHVFENALTVPRAAVVRGSGGPRVRRPGNVLVDVRLGACLPLECVVESGLSEGERVALR